MHHLAPLMTLGALWRTGDFDFHIAAQHHIPNMLRMAGRVGFNAANIGSG
jgi:hypothetical protein